MNDGLKRATAVSSHVNPQNQTNCEIYCSCWMLKSPGGIEISNFLQEITGIQFHVIAYVDNKSVIESLKSTKLVNDKRVRIDIPLWVTVWEQKKYQKSSGALERNNLPTCQSQKLIIFWGLVNKYCCLLLSLSWHLLIKCNITSMAYKRENVRYEDQEILQTLFRKVLKEREI